MLRLKVSAIASVTLHFISVSSMTSDGRAGHGLIGYGINMYHPPCAYSCRAALASSTLNCSGPSMEMPGMDMVMADTSPECYATDNSFLQSLAHCMSSRCQNVPLWDLEKYWLRNVAGAAVHQPNPKETYQQALANVPNGSLPILIADGNLSATMSVSDEDYETNYNALTRFEKVETNHETYGIVLIVTGSALPILFSLLRFVPFPATWVSTFNAWFVHPPAFGSRHSAPVAGLFHVPTRGQGLFILYLVTINIILSFVGIKSKQPNAWFSSAYGIDGEIACYITNRVGVLSFANLALLILYAGRNNILLWVTNWSHSTFLLLHRWVAWIATIQACLHSVIYLAEYIHDGTYSSESKLTYWIWGIVATLCMSILLPSSVFPIRQKLYELFLVWHIILAIFTLVGCYWHIVARFQHQWGYENWIYTAIAIWGFDRFMRFARLLRNGARTAQVTVIDDDYIRVDIEDVHGSGHAYLYFPSLTWRVWENHPFSVASTVLTPSRRSRKFTDGEDIEKLGGIISISETGSDNTSTRTPAKVGLTFLLRTRTGLTGHLRDKQTLPVLVESGYGQHEDLSRHSKLVCITGGVGITACIPYLQAHPGEVKLHWGVRTQGIVEAMSSSLHSNIEKKIYLEHRMSIPDVLEQELSNCSSNVALVVSGPNGMADEVRCALSERCRRDHGIKVKFVEEAFSW